MMFGPKSWTIVSGEMFVGESETKSRAHTKLQKAYFCGKAMFSRGKVGRGGEVSTSIEGRTHVNMKVLLNIFPWSKCFGDASTAVEYSLPTAAIGLRSSGALKKLEKVPLDAASVL